VMLFGDGGESGPTLKKLFPDMESGDTKELIKKMEAFTNILSKAQATATEAKKVNVEIENSIKVGKVTVSKLLEHRQEITQTETKVKQLNEEIDKLKNTISNLIVGDAFQKAHFQVFQAQRNAFDTLDLVGTKIEEIKENEKRITEHFSHAGADTTKLKEENEKFRQSLKILGQDIEVLKQHMSNSGESYLVHLKGLEKNYIEMQTYIGKHLDVIMDANIQFIEGYQDLKSLTEKLRRGESTFETIRVQLKVAMNNQSKFFNKLKLEEIPLETILKDLKINNGAINTILNSPYRNIVDLKTTTRDDFEKNGFKTA